MIITKEVKIVLGGINISHFKNLGYNIPKIKGKWGYVTPHGTEILVKVVDLPKSSKAEIQCYCNECLRKNKKEIVNCTYKYYYEKKNKNEDILCDKCKKEITAKNIKNSEYHIKIHNKAITKKEIELENKRIEKEQKRLNYLNEIRDIALDIGLIPDFNNEDYIDKKHKLNFICPIHGDTPKTPSQIEHKYRCKYCAQIEAHKKQKYNYTYVKSKYLENGFILMERTYENVDTPMRCYCINHPNKIQYKSFRMILDNRICFYCQHEMQQKEGHPSWKGGLTLLYNDLRRIIEPWKFDSSNFYKGKCILTGSYETVIHHLHKSFKSIIDECLNYYNVDLNYSTVSALNKDELFNIESMILDLHYKYGYGIPLHKEIHNLFHKLYTTKNNTPEQFEEFKTRLKSGEFNLFLEENNLTLKVV